jgi:uncharacterized RDD family membrane protein YckC
MKNVHFAGFWRRLSASLFDMLITAPILISLIYLFGLDKYIMIQLDETSSSFLENRTADIVNRIIDLISITIAAFYSVIFISSKKKATVGKMLFGICVVDVKGRKLTKLKAFARFFTSIISVLFFGIGVLMIPFTKEKTAFHDLICKTRVIKSKK